MSGRGEDRGGDSPRVWLRGALVVVAIVALLGAFGLQSGLQRPQLKPVNYAGIDLTRLPTALDRLSHCMEE